MREMHGVTRPQDYQRGFTLVEIMIAATLSLILLSGVLQIFASSRQTYRVQEGLSQIQENGRFAIEFLARDIRMADFWGCANLVSKVTNNLNPLGGSGYFDITAGGLQGVDGGGNSPDSITLLGGYNAGIQIQPPYGPQASAVVKVPPGTGLSQGDIIFVSDCSAADIFQITNSNPDSSGQLVHNTGAAVTPGNFNATNPGCPGSNAHCLSKIYGADANVYRMRRLVYSIGNGTSGQPALFRSDGVSNLELVDGIENLQILYGEDLDPPGAPGFGTADYYVSANNVTDMENVVSVQVALLARSYQDNLTAASQVYNYNGSTVNPSDKYLRQVFTTTVAIRNRVQ